jgi:hypothetical protein
MRVTKNGGQEGTTPDRDFTGDRKVSSALFFASATPFERSAEIENVFPRISSSAFKRGCPKLHSGISVTLPHSIEQKDNVVR